MSPRPTWRTPVRAASATLALLTVILLGLAGPAQAQSIAVPVGPINTAQVDLGGGPTQTNQPNGAPLLIWNRFGNTVRPQLVLGWVSLYNSPGYCGTVRVSYWAGNTPLFEEFTSSVCASGPGVTGRAVQTDGTFTAVLTRVDVSVMLRTFNGNWQEQQTVSLYP